MAEVHILNVGQGDCNIIKSNKGRITMFDICGGNKGIEEAKALLAEVVTGAAVKGNYRMCEKPTNPIDFVRNTMGASSVFRFILSHPDMDHMDGFDNLMNNVNVYNFWDSGVRKEKPDFSGGPYQEKDWDRYEKVRDGKEDGVTVISPKAGDKNKFFNQDDDGGGGDFIYIYAPSSELVDEANKSNNGESINDGSYVIVYRSAGGRILLPGDAHDKTWEYVIDNSLDELENCEFMLAPHHGRDSGRSWDFLDKIKPKFSVLGCASSEHLAYNQWNRRGLEKITQNQAGNVAIYPDSEGLSIYVENDKFVEAYGGDVTTQDEYGNYYLTHIDKSSNY